MAISLGTNAVVVTRVHCSYHLSMAKALDYENGIWPGHQFKIKKKKSIIKEYVNVLAKTCISLQSSTASDSLRIWTFLQ